MDVPSSPPRQPVPPRRQPAAAAPSTTADLDAWLRRSRLLGHRVVQRGPLAAITVGAAADVLQRAPDDDLLDAARDDDATAAVGAVAAGANVDAVDARGRTALMHSLTSADLAVFAYLAGRANVTLADNDGWTALHYAISWRRVEAIDPLLRRGANLTATTTDTGETPLAMAGNRGGQEITRLLYDRAIAAGHALTAREAEQVRGVIYKDESRVAGEVKTRVAMAYVTALSTLPAVEPVASADTMATRLRGSTELLFTFFRAQLGFERTRAEERPDRNALDLVLADLGHVEPEVLEECCSMSVSNVLKWIGHLTGQEGRETFAGETVSLSGWSPGPALFLKCVALADTLETKGLIGKWAQFVRDELEQCSFAFQRAVELEVVQRLFTYLGNVEQVSVLLSRHYAKVAELAGSFRLPSGTRLHTTYLTGATGERGELTLLHHNLGRLADRRHESPEEYQYYPYVVERIEPRSLASIFQQMILTFVVLDSFDTDTVLGELYDALARRGTVLTDREAFRQRYAPSLQQLVNNCSVENLRSATQAEAVLRFGAASAGRFLGLLETLELDVARRLAEGLAGDAGDRAKVAELVGPGAAAQKLRNAALLGNEAEVRTLLTAHAGIIDRPDSDGHTALHLAANKGHLAIVRLLLAQGADPLVLDGKGKPPIVHGADNLTIVRLLEERYPVGRVKSYRFIPHTVPLYRDLRFEKIADLPAETTFRVLGARSDKWAYVLAIGDTGAVAGWIDATDKNVSMP